MQWDDVRLLLVVLDVRNLHDAAQRLGLDRSTVSRRLAGLERRLGTRLFVRTREGLRPTPAAERVGPFAERMAAEAAGLAAAVRSDSDEVVGVVRLATTEAIATLLIDEGLFELRDRHPELALDLSTGNAPIDLLRGEADLAVRVSPLRHASLRVRCVARLKAGLFAAPSYVKRRGRPTTAAGWRGHDVIVPSGDLAQLPEARWLASRPGVRVAFRSNSLPVLRAAAARGLGVVPLTAPWGDRDPQLQRLQLLDDLPKRAIWLVSPPLSATRAAVRVVADRVAAIFARI
jgi:DNA-binding transcriptional LysR family regulator